MPKLGDRIKETSTTTGTGDFTLSGAVTGYVTFNSVMGTNTIFVYVIDSGGTDWEIGRGYLSGSTTLVRDIIVVSSNSNNVVNFSAGTKNVFCTISNDHIARISRGRTIQANNGNFSF
jgi:hypothetical protein